MPNERAAQKLSQLTPRQFSSGAAHVNEANQLLCPERFRLHAPRAFAPRERQIKSTNNSRRIDCRELQSPVNVRQAAIARAHRGSGRATLLNGLHSHDLRSRDQNFPTTRFHCLGKIVICRSFFPSSVFNVLRS